MRRTDVLAAGWVYREGAWTLSLVWARGGVVETLRLPEGACR